jgi:hypothetical protein
VGLNVVVKRNLNSTMLVLVNAEKIHHTNFITCTCTIIRMTKSRRMRWARHLEWMGDKKNTYSILVGKRPVGRRKHRWVDNIKMDFRVIGWGAVEWIDLV